MSDDETRDGPPADGPGDDAATRPTATPRRSPAQLSDGGWRVPTPARQIEQRIASVARAIIDGLGRAAILQAVAKAQQTEATKRERVRLAALKSGETPSEADASARREVPVIWGDGVPAQRTVDLYIRRAKDAIGDEGKKLSKQREYVLGMQIARCNDVYQAAFAAKRYATCVMVIREVNEMFGIREAIKIMLLGAADSEHAKTGASDLTSEQGKASALSQLIEKATQTDPSLAGVFARFARATPLPAGALDAGALAIELPPPKHEPPSNGSNGSNGNGNGNGSHA